MKKILFAMFSILALGLLGCSLSPKQEYNEDSRKTMIHPQCTSFFDGCNNCVRVQEEDDITCTRMYCEKYEKPECLDSMDPSWDANQDGLNDCELDDTCDDSVDYTQPRPISGEEDIILPEMAYDADSRKTIISNDCVHFFDGCNNCNRVEGSDIVACTLMYCETYEEPTCLLENK